MEARRCNIHGLIAASDGRCIICRRGDGDEEPAPRALSSTTLVIAVGGLAIACLLAFWIWRPQQARPPADTGTVIRADTPGATSDPTPPRAPTPQRPTPFAAPTAIESAGSEAAPDASSEADARLDAAKHRVLIKMYSTAWCPYCKRARAWFQKNGYRYAELDIERSETDSIEMRSLNPAMTTPTFDLQGTPLVGFDPATFDAALTRIASASIH